MATVGEQGFTIDVTRVFFKDGKEVKRDKKLTTVYRPELDLKCVPADVPKAPDNHQHLPDTADVSDAGDTADTIIYQ